MKKEEYSKLKLWLDNDVDIENRKIFFMGDVDECDLNNIIKVLMYLDSSSDKPIDIYISSFGGSVYCGLALYDVIESCKCKIRTHAIGKVMSMGLILFLAGKERYATKRTTFMSHTVSNISWGKLSDMKQEVDETERIYDICLDILAAKTKKKYTKAWWKKEIEHLDRYYSYKQAKEMGMITHED